MRIKIFLSILVTGVVLGLGAAAQESNTDQRPSQKVTTAQRNQMAQVHEKMAECLHSNKPLDQCRSEMRRSCQEFMDNDGCPMMGKMGHMGRYGNSAAGTKAPKNTITMSNARAKALKEFPGTVKSGELEQEEGKWVYSFDIVGPNNITTEVWVDAKNGKVIKHQVESAAEEAKEADHG